jgi:hypothetical protein
VTVRILDYRGDGTYYLRDGAHELDGIRAGPPGRVLGANPASTAGAGLAALLDRGAPGGATVLDVIVAAPKPVSVLLASEPPRAASAVVALHERGVAAVLGYLDGEHLSKGGARLGAVGFTHGINRLGDPHLHTHVLVGVRDGVGAPVDGHRLRARARTADGLYLAELRVGMQGAAGRSAWVGRSGTTCVEGVDIALLAATTTPRGRDGRHEHGAPKQHPSAREVRRHWDALLATVEPLGVPTAPARRASIDEYRFSRDLGEGTVARHDVVRAWASACTFGARSTEVLAAATLVAPGLADGRRRPAVSIRDAPGVRALGPRPTDPGGLERWCDGRAALARYLAEGHLLAHLEDPRGAPAATWLAVARLDATLSASGVGRGAARTTRDAGLDRSIS